MTRCYGTISLWIFGLVFLFVGVNINEPYYLISLRGLGAAALAMVFSFSRSSGDIGTDEVLRRDC